MDYSTTSNIFSDRNRELCKDCIYYNYLHCAYVKVDGFCSFRNIKVRDNK
jgi:hypothetical protein